MGSESAFVECIPDETYGEDCYGKGIASIERFAAGEFCDCFVVVFGSCGKVPESWVEDY